MFRLTIWTYQFYTPFRSGINFCPRLSDRRSECVTV